MAMSDIQIQGRGWRRFATADRPWLSPLNQRRWQNFKANRRGYWSLWIFLVLFVLSLFAEFIANDKPVLASYKGEILVPGHRLSGGEVRRLLAITDYRDPVIQEEIEANGWMIWPPIRYSYRTVNNDIPQAAPTKPSWLYSKEERCSRYAARGRRTIPTARSATGTGSAPTTRRATCWPASSTVSASPCCSAWC
jgi:microcin C transport system permease protein